ncbi:DNA damage-binding protein CMR1 [Hanseniaspora osmophila]|uniref:DNA damage-binding protein CMR1 n=1 Tax=Hanseniaspora osmophila TaxID=56408 RepID=A0A1E5RBA0_9ASCO|nr:DNA damage-binding protein CMR1 [Hanseniaspora osmophila]
MAAEELSEFQKKRLENIKRNNALLSKLNLKNISNKISSAAGASANSTAKLKKRAPVTKKTNRVKKETIPTAPLRQSRRLRGQTADGNVLPNVSDSQLFNGKLKDGVKLEDDKENQEWHEELKDTRVSGDVSLGDLLDDSKLASKYSDLSKLSNGDLFEEWKKYEKGRDSSDGITASEKQLHELREEFDLQLYPHFEPNEIKITDERISAMFYHPMVEQKLIIAGDVSGNLGFWKVPELPKGQTMDEEEIPDITKFKLFQKNVGNICCQPSNMSKIVTSSYDGTLRTIDLNNMKSEELLYNVDVGGISDLQFQDENVAFMTTLEGEFLQYDLRVPVKKVGEVLRLADKKIGSFHINPKNSHEIATGSLDRTLRVWDVRKLTGKPEWSQYEDYNSCEIVRQYDSRLSVSAVNYSTYDDTLVCNGYDNTIRLFDVSWNNASPSSSSSSSSSVKKEEGGGSANTSLEPFKTIMHNCKTGKWTSILKARFKLNRDVFAIANMSRAIDIYTSKGDQIAHLQTATVPAVVAWHPFENWIVGGNSSGKVFLFG